MEIAIRSPQRLLSPALRLHIQRRLGFALDRLRWLIRRIEVRLIDSNGPRGGIDKQCTAVLVPRFGQAVKVESSDSDAYRAIDEASRKLKKAFHRRVGRTVGVMKRRIRSKFYNFF